MSSAAEAGTHHAHDAHHAEHRPTGWRRWVYSTNHKDIGTMYIVFALVGGVVGGIFSMVIAHGAVGAGTGRASTATTSCSTCSCPATG